MKKLLTLFAFAATMLSLAACSSNDDDDSRKNDASLLVGTWKLTKTIDYDSPSNTTGRESQPLDFRNLIMTFNSDEIHKYVHTSAIGIETHITATYTLRDGKIYYDDGSGYYEEYVFSGDNNLITTYYNPYYYDNSDVVFKTEYYWVRQ